MKVKRRKKRNLCRDKKKYLQVLPSHQQDLGDPEGQVYQTNQLDQLDQQHLSHQENPVCDGERDMVSNKYYPLKAEGRSCLLWR